MPASLTLEHDAAAAPILPCIGNNEILVSVDPPFVRRIPPSPLTEISFITTLSECLVERKFPPHRINNLKYTSLSRSPHLEE